MRSRTFLSLAPDSAAAFLAPPADADVRTGYVNIVVILPLIFSAAFRHDLEDLS